MYFTGTIKLFKTSKDLIYPALSSIPYGIVATGIGS